MRGLLLGRDSKADAGEGVRQATGACLPYSSTHVVWVWHAAAAADAQSKALSPRPPKLSPRRSLSWLKQMVLQANMPYASLRGAAQRAQHGAARSMQATILLEPWSAAFVLLPD